MQDNIFWINVMKASFDYKMQLENDFIFIFDKSCKCHHRNHWSERDIWLNNINTLLLVIYFRSLYMRKKQLEYQHKFSPMSINSEIVIICKE